MPPHNMQRDASATPPPSFICPITHDIMENPVIDNDGNSYEKSAITRWIREHMSSPVTRLPLRLDDLTPNRSLRSLIEASPFRPTPMPSADATCKSDDTNKGVKVVADNTALNLICSTPLEKGKESDVLVRIKPPMSSSPDSRPSANMVLIIDVSGSMGGAANPTKSDNDVSFIFFSISNLFFVRNFVPNVFFLKYFSKIHGLSVLDIVKHASKTIIHSLTSRDCLSIVTYSNSANVIFPVTQMDSEGKTTALDKIKSLRPTGGTNLWAGLKSGLDLMSSKVDHKMHSSLLLFTDGMPNIVPPRGHIAMLREYKDKQPSGSLPCSINTFGFGYSLDSKLLDEIAQEGQGMYSFIPDSSFLGTCFVNAVSNLLCTVANDVDVHIEAMNGATVRKCQEDTNENNHGNLNSTLCGFPFAETSWGLKVNIGQIRDSQTSDILFHVTIPPNTDTEAKVQENNQPVPYVRVVMNYRMDYAQPNNRKSSSTTTCPSSEKSKINLRTIAEELFIGDNVVPRKLKLTNDNELETGLQISSPHVIVEEQLIRSALVDTIRKALKMAELHDIESSQVVVESLVKRIKNSSVISNSSPADEQTYVNALLQDVTGEITKAFADKKAFKKWGQHYLPSLARAHQLQICSNFKDPGLQVYANGSLFQNLRDKADDLYCSLPPPIPSHNTGFTYGNGPSFAARYHNSNNACFAGSCQILMADGSRKNVADVRSGDRVACPHSESMQTNGTAVVELVVQTKCANNVSELALFPNGLKITPWHPVLNKSGVWCFPTNLTKTKEVKCPFVYSFLLKRIKDANKRPFAVCINGIWCCTLAHGIQDDTVVTHAYFGTEKIIHDLKNMEGFQNGLIKLQAGAAIRDEKTNLIIGLRQDLKYIERSKIITT